MQTIAKFLVLAAVIVTGSEALALTDGKVKRFSTAAEFTSSTHHPEGTQAWAADTNVLYVYSGSAWVPHVASFGAVPGPLAVIRFCGNGHNGATATYMGPVLLDDTEADLAFGGAGCDGLDNATEATADAPWHAGLAFKPVAMVCVGLCTGASTANDAVTYQLRDDTASVSGMTCTATAWTADATPQQCTVTDSTPETVAANSAVAVKISGTDDACTDAGDDFECLLYVTF